MMTKENIFKHLIVTLWRLSGNFLKNNQETTPSAQKCNSSWKRETSLALLVPNSSPKYSGERKEKKLVPWSLSIWSSNYNLIGSSYSELSRIFYTLKMKYLQDSYLIPCLIHCLLFATFIVKAASNGLIENASQSSTKLICHSEYFCLKFTD